MYLQGRGAKQNLFVADGVQPRLVPTSPIEKSSKKKKNQVVQKVKKRCRKVLGKRGGGEESNSVPFSLRGPLEKEGSHEVGGKNKKRGGEPDKWKPFHE